LLLRSQKPSDPTLPIGEAMRIIRVGVPEGQVNTLVESYAAVGGTITKKSKQPDGLWTVEFDLAQDLLATAVTRDADAPLRSPAVRKYLWDTLRTTIPLLTGLISLLWLLFNFWPDVRNSIAKFLGLEAAHAQSNGAASANLGPYIPFIAMGILFV